jgi:hypothetical protein
MSHRKSLTGYALLVIGFLLIALFMTQGVPAFLLIGLLGIILGAAVIVRGKVPTANQDWERRRKALLGARRMIREEKRLDDTRLAAILEIDVSEVSSYLDFGINSGFLPADASQGLPEDKLGHLVIDVHGRLDPRESPEIHVDGNRYPSRWGSNLYSLPPGPHKITIAIQRPFKLDFGLTRASTTVFLSAGELKGLCYLPSLLATLTGKKKLEEYN